VALLAALLSTGCAENRDGWVFRRSADNRCAQIEDRISRDHEKIDQIDPTGQNRDTPQSYRDDLENARRDLDYCRYGS
jgi:hypothetical protein